MKITFQDIRTNVVIKTYIKKADDALAALGYTEHSFAHVLRVSEVAAEILSTLGYTEHEIDLVRIAGYMHDIGNLVNRVDHSQSGALMAFRLLNELHMDAEDISDIVSTIGNHDEGTGVPISAMAAALILADKSDVRKSRVRNTKRDSFDIHDRVNYSVESSRLSIDDAKQNITLTLTIDTSVGSVMDYFEIFLERMILCRKAADKLGLYFRLNINGQHLI
ncbi:MAG: HD domain-containing protein [Clostridia bacterium]|nr:HD domain-containing protein [Clostridia bacterium]